MGNSINYKKTNKNWFPNSICSNCEKFNEHLENSTQYMLVYPNGLIEFISGIEIKEHKMRIKINDKYHSYIDIIKYYNGYKEKVNYSLVYLNEDTQLKNRYIKHFCKNTNCTDDKIPNFQFIHNRENNGNNGIILVTKYKNGKVKRYNINDLHWILCRNKKY